MIMGYSSGVQLQRGWAPHTAGNSNRAVREFIPSSECGLPPLVIVTRALDLGSVFYGRNFKHSSLRPFSYDCVRGAKVKEAPKEKAYNELQLT